MARWYEIEKTEQEIDTFLNLVHGFHDYRIEKVIYDPDLDIVDILLMYDSCKEGILLRFVTVYEMNIYTGKDYEAEWIFSSDIYILKDGKLLWFEDESALEKDKLVNKNLKDEIENYITFVSSEKILYAHLDENKDITDMPEVLNDGYWAEEILANYNLKEYKGCLNQ